MVCVIASLLVGVALVGANAADEEVIVDFGEVVMPKTITLNNASMERVPHEDGHARLVRFAKTDWPNVFFAAPRGAWDWRDYAGIAVSLYNPSDEAIRVALRADNLGADGGNNCNTANGTVPPKARYILRLRFNTGGTQYLWGMRGLPVFGAVGSGPEIDTKKIVAYQVFLPRPGKPRELIFEKAWLLGDGGTLRDLIPAPFIDRFGQFRHADWPGKLHDEEDLGKRAAQERALLDRAARLPQQDEYGAWADGPKREASGWFRTEKIDGKWWLVAPNGHLFFSAGVDCVGTWSSTFVAGRGDWFAELPERNAPPFNQCYSFQRNAHSGAEVIRGEGLTFGFYAANLIRKYGETWKADWRNTTNDRLRAWGFNTIGNWSQEDVLVNSPMPFVATTSIGGMSLIRGGAGYWSKMMDVYSFEFEERADAAFAWVKGKYAGNPLCIGFFCDNELAWEGIKRGTLESPASQSCRIELIRMLQEKYYTMDRLNQAWGIRGRSWDELRTPKELNKTANADLDEYLYRFARRYFEVVKKACHKYAPNQLYLGCRFSGPPPPPVERACAEVADVMSFNLYRKTVPADKWTGEHLPGVPLMIGEFHFGALDRGMFHTGLAGVENQEERGKAYARYVRSVATHPAFVGCHWFQYVDEPTTGRWIDGENYNIGFVNITDTPYPELVDAAKKVHAQVYALRHGN